MEAIDRTYHFKKTLEKKERFVGGHRLCAGCGAGIAVRGVLRALREEDRAVVGNATGCLEVSSFLYPYTAYEDSYIHTAFESAGATLSGVEAAYNALKRKGQVKGEVKFITFGGDGGTYDIGFQSLSGAMERGHDLTYVCYDNEGYMNTGYQRSSTTTEGSRTSTTPLGSALCGKQQPQKYIPLILAMHGVEYSATATPWNMRDMVEKIEKGLAASKRGFAYLHVFSPCPTGWSFAPDQTIEVSKRAVKSNMFPLWEKSEGKYTLNYKNADPIPVADFVKGIGKFKKLSAEQLASIQRAADERYATVCALAGM